MLDWDWDLIQAMHRVAQRFPEHGAELYIVGERDVTTVLLLGAGGSAAANVIDALAPRGSADIASSVPTPRR